MVVGIAMDVDNSRMDGQIRLIVGFQPLMVILPTANWCVCTRRVQYIHTNLQSVI